MKTSARRYLFLFFIVCFQSFFNLVFTQSKSAYTPLTSKAPIPEDFLVTSTEKYENNSERIDEGASQGSQKVQDQFFLESSFMIDNLLKSGKVLFNDEAGEYVNKIADQILKNQPDLRNKIRFYVVQSPIPNAFTTDQGVILINQGLLARLNTEAQLAFILCHEISHYEKKHVFNRYIQFRTIDLEEGDYENIAEYEKLLLKSNYSQQNEMEADQLGLEMFFQSGYGVSTIPEVFDILAQSDSAMLSFTADYTPLFSRYFTNSDWEQIFVFPEKTDSIPKVKGDVQWLTGFEEEEEEDNDTTTTTQPEVTNNEPEQKADTTREENSIGTHPAPMARKNEINRLISEKALPDPGNAFIISPETFSSIRNNARFAVIDLYLDKGYFLDALHQILALYQEYPNDIFLREKLAYSLYAIAKYRRHKKSMDVLLNYEGSEEDEKIIEFFSKIDQDYIQMMAISFVWEFAHESGSDTTTNYALFRDLLFELHNSGWENDPEKVRKFTQDSLTTAKIADLSKEEGFLTFFNEAKKEQEDYADFLDYMDTNQGQANYNRFRKKQLRRGYHLGISKVVVFDPVFYRLDLRPWSDEPLKLIYSENQLEKVHEYIYTSAEKLDIEVTILDSKIMTQKQNFTAFEDYAQITQWHDQWAREDDFTFVPSNYKKVVEISDRYGTPYFMQMGAISGRVKKPAGNYMAGLILSFIPGTFPLGVYTIGVPLEKGFVFSLLYDVRDNRRLMNYYQMLHMKTASGNLLSHVYYHLRQVKREKR
ncbi:MAG: M48 family metallopeptidase [Bacteroidetes bacterium]|nr:M48 family metallopeptidase [Bacteroidota bacterium]